MSNYFLDNLCNKSMSGANTKNQIGIGVGGEHEKINRHKIVLLYCAVIGHCHCCW